MKNLLHTFDHLLYRLWYYRWTKRFKKEPYLAVPFYDTFDTFVHKHFSEDQLNKLREFWRKIDSENP